MSGPAIRRHTYGTATTNARPFIGIATSRSVPPPARSDHVRIVHKDRQEREDYSGYGALLTDGSEADLESIVTTEAPVLFGAEHLEHITDGDILRLDYQHALVRSLYRINSRNNIIFATDRCNSNCLMCSQPPKDVDDSYLVGENLRLVSLVPPTTRDLTITGGEPTLLGDGLFDIIEACRDRLPVTRLHMLTNGRMFSYRSVAKRVAETRHPQLTLGIPLYSDHCVVHDYVVQARGAFDQTVVGLHNLARFKQKVEIRVVVHKQTFARLPQLAQFIYRNCPFAEHVAIMGLELMGYTKTNLKQLWIDPVDYQSQLEEAVRFLAAVGMNVSIYNHQLCVLPRSLWPYSKKSISDFKNIYLDECQRCSVVDECGGLFRSAEKIHSKHIAAIA
jgi:His-Xaa-Ser system radical SAM maturase HxsC